MMFKVCNTKNGVPINIREYEKNVLLKLLKTNNNLYEYIDTKYVKPYFDIDIKNLVKFAYSKGYIQTTVINQICNVLKCNKNDLVILDGTRNEKISFHIICKKYKITPSELFKLSKFILSSDKSVYQIEPFQYKVLRCVNQSKLGCNSYNTHVPLKLVYGKLEDCIITDTEGLNIFE